MKSIGLDIGTTSITCLVFDIESNQPVFSKTVPNQYRLENREPDHYLQDADLIVDCIIALLEEAHEAYPDIASIGVTGQMHGIVYTNKEGLAVSPLFTWQNNSGHAPVPANSSDDAEDKLTFLDLLERECGRREATGYGLVTYYVHQQLNLVPAEATSFCTISDYVVMRLTGSTKPLLHITNAASLGMFDLEANTFDFTALKRGEFNTELLPSATSSFDVAGYWKEIPVLVAIGDNQAAYYGAVDNKENCLLFNVGTGSQMALVINRYVEIEGLETRPLDGTSYLLVGAGLTGGKAYSILEDFFSAYASILGIDGSQYSVMEILGNEVTNTDLIVNTHFKGTRRNPDDKGSILNITPENFTPANLVYGFLAGIIDELADFYELASKDLPIQPSHFIGAGNGLRKNSLLQKIASERIGLPIQIPAYEEEAASGVAKLAYQYHKE